VILLDTDSLIHVRLAPGKKALRVISVKSYALAANTFNGGLVTPDVVNDEAIADVLRRIRMETGKWERVSLLLPDSWFRMNILDVPSLPDKEVEAMEVVRWSLKRTLPIPPEELRIARHTLSVTPTGGAKVLAVSAREKTLASIERVFTAAGFDIVLIEPVGLNIWNSITVREKETTGDRLLLFIRERDFTTAVFRGNQPVFLRSRNLSADRLLEQEIRLSASYLREALRSDRFETCYVAGDVVSAEMVETVAREFNSPVHRITASEFAADLPGNATGYDAAITASAGVFA
jgi:type IV pilus assembly protein PilM